MPDHGDLPSSGSEAFDKWRAAVTRDPQLRREMEWAMAKTVDTFNVSDRGMRFIVGTIGEWLAAFSAYAAGVITLPGGHNLDGYDLEGVLEANRELWSVKSSYSPHIGTFIISNGRGGAGRGFVDPTIFWHPRLPGIVYVDPKKHVWVKEGARETKDAWELKRTSLAAHAEEHPECVIPMTIPVNPGTAKTDPGYEAVKLIVQSGPFTKLDKMLRDTARVGDASVASQIQQLKVLRDEGSLTEEQFARAVDKVTGA